MAGAIIGRGCLYRASGIVVASVVLAASIARAQQEKSPTIADVQKAWQARQDRVRTARFTWKEQRTWPKGSISSTFGPAALERIPEVKGKIMPPADKTVDFSYTLAMDNDKVRFEYEGSEWANAKQDFRPVKYVSVFDGKTAKHLYPDGVGHADWPVGVIHKGADYRDAGLAALRPLLLVYRPFVATLQPTDIQEMTLEGEQAVIDGRMCVELVQRLPKNSSVQLWVDTTQDFLLVRRLIIEQGKPLEQIDIHYRVDRSSGWVPTDWKIVNYGSKGRLLCSINAVLTSGEFNIGVDPSLFDFDFPPGARVQDERMNNHGYILRHDGTKRAVLDEDIGATYEQMVNTAPGQALYPQYPKSKSLTRQWVLAIFAATGLLALGVLIWRRLRLKESPR
ncbi:MAG TPA: hypothetical protein VH682_29770 [Gemmataceae bacterium]|jgi:hypothetical protein